MLSEVFLDRVYDSLNSKYFTVSDFSISQRPERSDRVSRDQAENIVLVIQYRYKREFSITASINHSKCYTVKILPGQVMRVDRKKDIEIDEFLSVLIPTWLSTLNKYFTNSPYIRHVIKHEKRIDELEAKIDEAIGDLDEDFLEDEITLLKERLTNMEKEITERLNQQIQSQEILNKRIEELNKDIQILKNQAGPLDKKNWLLSFYTKLYLWNERNPSLLPKSILHIAYNSLPESVQKVIPEGIIDSTVDSFIAEPTVEEDSIKQ